MPLGGGIVAGAGGVISSIIGGNAAAKKEAAAEAARQAAVQAWLQVNVPNVEDQKVELQHYAVTGQLTPKHEQAFQQAQSKLVGMQIDPTSREAELKALQGMQDVASSGGMDAQARASEAQALNAAGAHEAGQRGAIEQSFAARGVGGAGAQLAAELQASQGDADQAASLGLQSASQGEQRALQAMAGAGSLAGTLNSQDYTQAANAAAAQDAINRFNTQTQQGVEHTNVSGDNSAQAANVANAQAVSNANVGVDNQQEMHNKGLYQQQFQDESQIAAGKANAEAGVATQANAGADKQTQLWGNIGNAVAQGAGAIANYANSKSDDDEEEEE